MKEGIDPYMTRPLSENFLQLGLYKPYSSGEVPTLWAENRSRSDWDSHVERKL